MGWRLIVLVFNNAMYGTIRMYQERAYPGRVSGTSLTNPDFAKFIEAFGGHGETVSGDGGVCAGVRAGGGQREAGGDRAGDESGADHQSGDDCGFARGGGWEDWPFREPPVQKNLRPKPIAR